MNNQRTRKAFAELAVGLLACGAVHMFLIAPQNEQLAKLQAETETLTRPVAGVANLTAEQLAQFAEHAQAEADRVTSLSRPAQDETELFAAIMSLAEKTGVRIDQLQPTGSPTRGVPPAAPGEPKPAGDAKASAETPAPPVHGAVGYSMSISASYTQLVAFVAALPRDIGFTVVRSVKARPADVPSTDPRAGEFVHAEVVTEHHWFDTSHLRRLAGAEPPPGDTPTR